MVKKTGQRTELTPTNRGSIYENEIRKKSKKKKFNVRQNLTRGGTESGLRVGILFEMYLED